MIRHTHSSIPVYIVEDHDDVLPLIYRNIGSRHLPFEGNTIIHFDAHPDLLISETLEEADAWNKEALYEELSIENWILPGCYTGQFSKICWIKPPWATQIENGSHKVVIGEHKGLIRVGTPLYYFLSDGIVVDPAELKHSRTFDLIVATQPDEKSEKDVIDEVPTNGYVLDVDLDFFCTADPFKDFKNRQNILEPLSDLFCLDYDRTIERSEEEYLKLGRAHTERLQLLKEIFQSLDPSNYSDSYVEEQLSKFPNLPKEIHNNMMKLASGVYEFFQLSKAQGGSFDYDWLQIYDVGRTCDLDELPHHLSSSTEIKDALGYFESFLRKLPCPPVIITIARSSLDGYCPIDKVKDIENGVRKVLEDVFGCDKIDVHIKYPNESVICLWNTV